MSVAMDVQPNDTVLPSFVRRVGNVIRLHVANPVPTLVLPWLIFAAVFALNYAIWIAVVSAAGGRDKLDPDAFSTSGAISWIYIFLLVAAAQAMSLTFAFALGLGITRREYFLGTVLYFTGLAAFYAAGVTALAALESATHGWGVEGYFFAPMFVGDMALVQQFAAHFMAALLLFATGLFAGAIYVRWRAVGLYIFFGGLAFALAALILIASLFDGWKSIGTFFTDQSPLAVIAWTVPWSLATAGLASLILRRATPR